MASGYTQCKCEGCFDVTVSDDETVPELCSECEDAGCTGHEGDECSREEEEEEDEEDEYGMMCELCGHEYSVPESEVSTCKCPVCQGGNAATN